MARPKKDPLELAKEKVAQNRAAKEAVANQGAENAPQTADQTAANDSQETVKPESTENKPEVQETEKDNDVAKDTETKPESKVEKRKTGAYIVISPFRDKADFSKTWAIGTDVSHFSADRLQKCIDLKLVEKK